MTMNEFFTTAGIEEWRIYTWGKWGIRGILGAINSGTQWRVECSSNRRILQLYENNSWVNTIEMFQ